MATRSGHRGGGRQKNLKELGSYENVLAVFKKYDANGNGELSWHELNKLMTDLNSGKWSDMRTDQLLGQLDRNSDGAVNINELLEYIFPRKDAMGGAAGNSQYEEVIEAFRRHDTNKNGTLDKREFTQLMIALKRGQGKAWDARQTEQVFRVVDKDGSGEVESDELIAWMFGVPSDRKRAAAAQDQRRSGRKHDSADAEGPLVVFEFECGRGAPEIAVDGITERWRRHLKGQVEVKKIVSASSKSITKVSARNGKIVFWDAAVMMAYRDNPFISPQSTNEWCKDMYARHIPRLLNGT